MAEVIPAILEKDFSEIERKISLVSDSVSWVQVDMADNTLVPNTTFLDPVPFSKIKNISLEAHLMVKKPVDYLDGLVKNGFRRVFAHVEADGIEDFLEKCQFLNCEVGLAIDGPTPLDNLVKYIQDLDAVLVMAIDAGFSGRPFREDTLEKIKRIHSEYFDMPIEVDGAMNYENASKVVEVGASRINSNSFIFGAEDPKESIRLLKSLVTGKGKDVI